MRILFLAGANSIHSYRWIKYFAERGDEVHWLSSAPLAFSPIEKVNFYKIKHFPLKPFQVCWDVICLKRLIKKINPDVLHAHYAGVNGLVGACSSFHPFIITTWGSDVFLAGKSRIKGPFVRFALRTADLITCDANSMKQAIIRMKINPEKIRIVYFGTDTDKFKPENKDEMLRNKLQLSNSPIVISLRNFEPIYDVQSLIKSIPLVLKEIPEAKFVIAGRGPEERQLKNLAQSTGVLESIRFAGFIPDNELPGYLTSADIYVSTSLSDAGIAASTAEAMACGLPVIITDSEENRKWVEEGGGFVVPVKNPRILAQKIVYLLKNPDLRKEFGKVNRRVIEERNNYYKEMEKMEKLYEETAKKN